MGFWDLGGMAVRRSSEVRAFGGLEDVCVACLGSLATYGRAMLLVWAVLQHTGALCCLFGQSCNIRACYVACSGSLATYGVLCCLFGQSCNLRVCYVACLVSLAIFRPPTLLVMSHLQYSDLQFC